MEILIVIVLVIVVLFILGGMDNNRPVTSWSDDKLHRMQAKLSYAGSAAMSAGQYDSAKKHYDKLEEVKAEIEKRKTQQTSDLSLNIKQLNKEEALRPDDMPRLIGIMGDKMSELTTRIMIKHSCSEAQAGDIISTKIKEMESDLRLKGLSEDQVAEALLKMLLSDTPLAEIDSDFTTQPELKNSSAGVRNAEDIVEEFGIGVTEFQRLFRSYDFSLSLSGKSDNWNADIDDFSRSIQALTEEEIELGKTDFRQAVLNRIIVRQMAGR